MAALQGRVRDLRRSVGFMGVCVVLQVTHNIGIDYHAALFMTSMTIARPTWQSAFSLSAPNIAFYRLSHLNSLVLYVRWFHVMSVPEPTATRMRLKSHEREWCLVEPHFLAWRRPQTRVRTRPPGSPLLPNTGKGRNTRNYWCTAITGAVPRSAVPSARGTNLAPS